MTARDDDLPLVDVAGLCLGCFLLIVCSALMLIIVAVVAYFFGC